MPTYLCVYIVYILCTSLFPLLGHKTRTSCYLQYQRYMDGTISPICTICVNISVDDAEHVFRGG